MTPGASRAAWPDAGPGPRTVPAPGCVPRDPAARDHRWPERWRLRTHLELGALDTAPGSARAHVRAVLHEWRADGDARHLHAPGGQVPPGPCPAGAVLPARTEEGGDRMTPVPVTITAPPRDDGDVSIIDDIDALGSAEAMLGCGNDNPYN